MSGPLAPRGALGPHEDGYAWEPRLDSSFRLTEATPPR